MIDLNQGRRELGRRVGFKYNLYDDGRFEVPEGVEEITGKQTTVSYAQGIEEANGVRERRSTRMFKLNGKGREDLLRSERRWEPRIGGTSGLGNQWRGTKMLGRGGFGVVGLWVRDPLNEGCHVFEL